MTSVDAFERLAAMTVPQGEWTLTIDFGATLTEATALSPDNNRQIVMFDGEHQMPSVVAVDDAGELRVGRAAEEIARNRPDRTERELKRRLGEKTAIVLGDRSYDPVVLVAAVLRHAADAAIDQLGSTPMAVRLTHPDTWSDARIAKLVEAGSSAGLVSVGTEAESVATAPTAAPTVMESANESPTTRTVFEEVPQSGSTTMPPQPPNAYTPIPPMAAVPDAPKGSVKKPVLAGIAIGAVLVGGLGFALTRGGKSTASPTQTTTTFALAVPETTPTKKSPVTLPPRKTPTTLFPSKDPNDTLPPLTPTTVLPRPTPPTSVKTPPTTVAPTPTTTRPPTQRTTIPTTAPAPPPPTTNTPATTAPAATNPQQAVDAMVLSPDDLAKAAARKDWRTGTYPELSPLCGLALPSPVAQQRSPVNVSVGDGAYVNVTTYAYAMASPADLKAMTDTVYQSASQCPDKTLETGGQRFTLEFIKPSESKPPLVDYSLLFGYVGRSDAGTSTAAYVVYTTLGNYAIRTEYQIFGQKFSEADLTDADKIRVAQIVKLFINAPRG
jgi:hypothetical protein